MKKTGETALPGISFPGRVVEYGVVDCRPLMDNAFRLGMPAGCFRIRRRECRHTAAKGAAEDAAATGLFGGFLAKALLQGNASPDSSKT